MAIKLSATSSGEQVYLKRTGWSTVADHAVCGWTKMDSIDNVSIQSIYSHGNTASDIITNFGAVDGDTASADTLSLSIWENQYTYFKVVPNQEFIQGDWLWFGVSAKAGTDTVIILAFLPGRGWRRLVGSYGFPNWNGYSLNLMIGNINRYGTYYPGNVAVRDFRVYNQWLTESQLYSEFFSSKPINRNQLYAWYPLEGKEDYRDHSGNGNDIDASIGDIYTEPDPWNIRRKKQAYSFPKTITLINESISIPIITDVTDGVDRLFSVGQTGITTTGSGFGVAP